MNLPAAVMFAGPTIGLAGVALGSNWVLGVGVAVCVVNLALNVVSGVMKSALFPIIFVGVATYLSHSLWKGIAFGLIAWTTFEASGWIYAKRPQPRREVENTDATEDTFDRDYADVTDDPEYAEHPDNEAEDTGHGAARDGSSADVTSHQPPDEPHASATKSKSTTPQARVPWCPVPGRELIGAVMASPGSKPTHSQYWCDLGTRLERMVANAPDQDEAIDLLVRLLRDRDLYDGYKPKLKRLGIEILDENIPLQERLHAWGFPGNLRDQVVTAQPQAEEALRADKDDPLQAIEDWVTALEEIP